MFKQRLLTSLVLISLVLLAIYYAKVWVLKALVLLLVVIGGWEWAQLVPIRRLVNKLFFMFVLLLLVYASSQWLSNWLVMGMVLWGFILFAVLTFPTSQNVWGYRILVSGACLLLLPLFANTLIAIYQHARGKDLIVYLLCLVWATDVGAYLVGKGWGRHKLIPLVSPGKSVEGAAGGFLLAMLVAVIGYTFIHPHHHALTWYVIAVGTALISMLGDLFISMLKRRCKLKDTGHVFPGHGGVLDRIDSLIAAAPLFYFGLTVLPLT